MAALRSKLKLELLDDPKPELGPLDVSEIEVDKNEVPDPSFIIDSVFINNEDQPFK